MKLSPFYLSIVVAAMLWSCSPKEAPAPVENQPAFDGTLTEAEIQKGILTEEMLWKFGRLGEVIVSADGKTVVFGLARFDLATNKSKTDIYSISTAGGEIKQLTNTAGPEFNLKFKPNSNKIGYLSSESGSVQVWEMDPEGQNKTKVSEISEGINSFDYSPDGSKIWYCQDVKLEKDAHEQYPDLPLSNVRIDTALMYRHWNDWADYRYSHIFIAGFENNLFSAGKDIMEGEMWDAPLAPGFDGSEIAWSPDSKKLAYTSKKLLRTASATSTNSDIYIYELETGETKNLSQGMNGYDKNPFFSPDGTKIAWQSLEKPGYESDKHRLFVLDFETGSKTDVSLQWDQDADNVSWFSDSTMYLTSGIKGTTQIYKVNPYTKQFTQITSGLHDYTAAFKSADRLIGIRMSMSMASEIFTIDEKTGQQSQLTFINKAIYEHIKMGKVEERWVKTTDGKQMLVWVIFPPNFDATKKYPTLLYCQGGPQSTVSQFWSYRWNFQLMAAHDYIIVAPNRRGVPSFGYEWNAQISGDYNGQNIKDYFSAIDDVKKEPYVNADRLGCVGASYGGYSVFYMAGHHQKRFKAFISHCGMYNFESFMGATEETFFPMNDLGGAYWDINNKTAQKSYANSPHKFVQNWDTPIMIVTGGKDFRIPYTESLQAFNAAQLRGIPSKLLFFPEETHFVLKPQNSVLWNREFFAWFDRWLKK